MAIINNKNLLQQQQLQLNQNKTQTAKTVAPAKATTTVNVTTIVSNFQTGKISLSEFRSQLTKAGVKYTPTATSTNFTYNGKKYTISSKQTLTATKTPTVKTTVSASNTVRTAAASANPSSTPTVATLIADFTKGNKTVAEMKAALQKLGVTIKNSYSTETQNVITFNYSNKAYQIHCNKEASAKSNDSVKTTTYSASDINSLTSDTSIRNEFFEIAVVENGRITKYALKQGKTMEDFEKAIYFNKCDKIINSDFSLDTSKISGYNSTKFTKRENVLGGTGNEVINKMNCYNAAYKDCITYMDKNIKPLLQAEFNKVKDVLKEAGMSDEGVQQLFDTLYEKGKDPVLDIAREATSFSKKGTNHFSTSLSLKDAVDAMVKEFDKGVQEAVVNAKCLVKYAVTDEEFESYLKDYIANGGTITGTTKAADNTRSAGGAGGASGANTSFKIGDYIDQMTPEQMQALKNHATQVKAQMMAPVELWATDENRAKEFMDVISNSDLVCNYENLEKLYKEFCGQSGISTGDIMVLGTLYMNIMENVAGTEDTKELDKFEQNNKKTFKELLNVPKTKGLDRDTPKDAIALSIGLDLGGVLADVICSAAAVGAATVSGAWIAIGVGAVICAGFNAFECWYAAERTGSNFNWGDFLAQTAIDVIPGSLAQLGNLGKLGKLGKFLSELSVKKQAAQTAINYTTNQCIGALGFVNPNDRLLYKDNTGTNNAYNDLTRDQVDDIINRKGFYAGAYIYWDDNNVPPSVSYDADPEAWEAYLNYLDAQIEAQTGMDVNGDGIIGSDPSNYYDPWASTKQTQSYLDEIAAKGSGFHADGSYNAADWHQS